MKRMYLRLIILAALCGAYVSVAAQDYHKCCGTGIYQNDCIDCPNGWVCQLLEGGLPGCEAP